MTNIAKNIKSIKDTKQNLKTVLIRKGAKISDSTPFKDYPEIVNTLNISENPTATDKVVCSSLLKDKVKKTIKTTLDCFSLKLSSDIIMTGGTLLKSDYSSKYYTNYLYTTEIPPLNTARSWEVQLKYTYSNTNSAYSPSIMGFTGTQDFQTPALVFEKRGNLVFYLSSTGSSWDLNYSPSAISPSEGTTYYLKAGFDGTRYYIDYNTTGWNDEFINAFELYSTEKVCCNVPIMFMNAGLNTNYFSGGILDLAQSKLVINGATYLELMKKIEYI